MRFNLDLFFSSVESNEVREGQLLGVDLAVSSTALYTCAPRRQFITELSFSKFLIDVYSPGEQHCPLHLCTSLPVHNRTLLQ